MRTIQTFSNPRCSFNTDSNAYTDDGFVWRWCLNDAVIEVDICRNYGIPCDEVRQQKARHEQLDKLLDIVIFHQPTGQEMFEMRSEFGADVCVTNVLTGQTFRT